MRGTASPSLKSLQFPLRPLRNTHQPAHSPKKMSTAKRNPPFRAEHCGSLLRPQDLVQKRYDVAAGKATQADLTPLEDKTIADVIKLQKDAGLKVVSSGEYAR